MALQVKPVNSGTQLGNLKLKYPTASKAQYNGKLKVKAARTTHDPVGLKTLNPFQTSNFWTTLFPSKSVGAMKLPKKK